MLPLLFPHTTDNGFLLLKKLIKCTFLKCLVLLDAFAFITYFNLKISSGSKATDTGTSLPKFGLSPAWLIPRSSRQQRSDHLSKEWPFDPCRSGLVCQFPSDTCPSNFPSRFSLQRALQVYLLIDTSSQGRALNSFLCVKFLLRHFLNFNWSYVCLQLPTQ